MNTLEIWFWDPKVVFTETALQPSNLYPLVE